MTVPAFPLAEGFGSTTTHGRGGSVIRVTNLNESGIGSFRAACEASGPRIVVFDVSGTIVHALKPLTIKNPGLYVAGMTSPGGICFAGEEIRWQTHDGCMRYVRIRTGDKDDPDGGWDNRDCMNTGSPNDVGGATTYNNIWDHLSVSWSVDENFTIWYLSHDCTLSNSITAEGLDHSFHTTKTPPFDRVRHSMALLCGIEAHRLSIVKNYLGDCNQRNMQIAGDLGLHLTDPSWSGTRELSLIDFRYNFIFNPGQEAYAIEHLGNRANIVGNNWRFGPNSKIEAPRLQCIRIASDANDAQIYIDGNIDPSNPDGSGDNWNMVRDDNGNTVPTLGHRLGSPLSAPAITPVAAKDVPAYVYANAGCRAPFQDSADRRVLGQSQRACWNSSSNLFVDSTDDVGGWPDLSGGSPPLDTNADGVPDAYASAHGFSVNTKIDDVISDDLKYTWIERWHHVLAGDAGAS